MRKLLTLVLTLATSMLPTHALDADADFVDYMENLERLEMERERIHQMLEAHEVSYCNIICTLCCALGGLFFFDQWCNLTHCHAIGF